MEHNVLWDDVIETRMISTLNRIDGGMFDILNKYNYRINYFSKQYKSKKAKRKLYNERLDMLLSILAKALRDMSDGLIMIKDQVILNQLESKYRISKRTKSRKFKQVSYKALLNATYAVYDAYDEVWSTWVDQLEHKTYFANYCRKT